MKRSIVILLLIPFLSFSQKIQKNEMNTAVSDSIRYMDYYGKPWQIIKEKDNIRIIKKDKRDESYYDDFYHMMLYSFHSDSWIFILKNEKSIHEDPILYKKRKLLTFINRRYKQNFTGKDFKDSDACLDYIINQELKK